MDNFIQYMMERLHRRAIFNMSPDRRVRKLSTVNTFKGKVKTDKKRENSSPLNNAKALTFKPRNDEFTDVNLTKVGDGSEAGEKKEPELPKIPEREGSFKNSKTFNRNREVLRTRKTSNPSSRVQILNEEGKRCSSVTAEVHHSVKDSYGFDENISRSPAFRRESNDFWPNLLNVPSISTSNLLEEIEAGLPSSYSLVNMLDHTPHTVTNVRTFARLSRVGKNLIQIEEDAKQIQNVREDSVMRVEHLQTEAYIQETLIDQVDKVIKLWKDRQKYLQIDYVETLRILLVAKLRYEAINMELQNVKLSGGEAKESNVGELLITDIDFKLNDSQILDRGPFVCVTFQKEHLFASQLQNEIIDGKLHFPVNFKFTDLNQNFIVYFELYQLNSGFKTKKETSKIVDLKSLMKLGKQKANKNSCAKSEERDFVCVGTASFRLLDVKTRQNGKIQINFNKVFRSEFEKTMSINLEARVFLNTEFSGFLNLFKNTCWHRLWCCLTSCSLQFWNYPEDRDNGKVSFESIHLMRCKEVKPVSMEVCIRPYTFTISLKGKDKSFLLCASSNRDMANWVNRLKSVIHYLEQWSPDF